MYVKDSFTDTRGNNIAAFDKDVTTWAVEESSWSNSSSLSLSNAVAGSSPYKIGLPQTTRHHSASDFGEKVGGEKEEG